MSDYDIIPITVNDGHKVFDCYMDKRRQLIFPSSITTSFAKELGWKWEETNKNSLWTNEVKMIK